jgi:hypothetical protein
VPDYVEGRSPPEADNKKNDPRSDFILLVYPCVSQKGSLANLLKTAIIVSSSLLYDLGLYHIMWLKLKHFLNVIDDAG